MKQFVFISLFAIMGIGGTSVYGEDTISFENALRETLANSPGVKVKRQSVVQQEGLLTSASGNFDWMVSGTVSNEKTHDPISPTTERYEEEVIYSLGIGKQLRNGIMIRSSVSTLDYQDDLTQKIPVNNSDISAEVVIPLLKGRGVENTAATELAARSNLTAAEQASIHDISGQLMTASDLYWQCQAASEIVSLYEDAISRDTRLVEIVELLVQGGELPNANLEQAKAKYYKSNADISGAKLDLYKARVNLAAVMGRNPSEEPPLTGEVFPAVIDESMLDTNIENSLVALALKNRGDYLASQSSVTSRKILLKQSQNSLYPKVDLTVRTRYNGLIMDSSSERYYKTLYDNLHGLNAFMSLSLELPIHNKAAKGNVIYNKSQVEEAELTLQALSLSITSEVRAATETLRSAIKRYHLARLSAESYQVAVDYENRKVKMGQSNLTSLIDMQDRYMDVRLAEKQALLQYTLALTELRYVTGSVFSGAGDTLVLDPAALLRLPVNQ